MIKIIESEINRNKRFMLGSISSLRYAPESPFQVIVGGNGSGKSTLLRLLTSYSPVAADYYTNGSIRTKIHNGDSTFVVGCEVSKKVKYTFEHEGENLNRGGTLGVQKELYAEFFNYTQDVHDIMLNDIRLTRIGPAKRMEVFSRIAGTDMSFAYRKLARLKKKHRDQVGAIGVLEETLAKKIVQDISDDEFKSLELRLAGYHETVTRLLRDYRSDIDDTFAQQYEQVMRDLTEFEVRLAKEGKRQFIATPINSPDRDTFVAQISEVENRLHALSTQEISKQEQYDQLTDMLKRMSDSSISNMETLLEEEASIRKQLGYNDRLTWYCNGVEYAQPTAAYDTIREILPDLQDALYCLPENKDKRFGNGPLTDCRERLKTGKEHLNSINAAITKAETQLEHLRQEHSASCPKCGYNSTMEKREREEIGIVNDLKQYVRQRQAIEARITELESQHESILDYFTKYQRVAAFEKTAPALKPFFAVLYDGEDLFDAPSNLISKAGGLAEDLARLAHQESLQKRLEELERILNSLREKDITGVDELKKGIAALHDEIEEITYQRVELHEDLKKKKSLLHTADQYEIFVEAAIKENSVLESKLEDVLNSLYNHIRRVTIEDIQGWIGVLTKELNDAKTNRDSIKDTRRQLEELQVTAKHCKIAVDAMSPVSGIIAQHMVGTITEFIDQMNQVISRIWTTPLVILPCDLTEDSELDYIFPVEVSQSPYLTPDVSNASDGQLEIIDFAFKIVSLMRLGQEGGFLFIDETDRPMEPIHKVRLMNYIKELIENEHFSQVFLVSHHEGAYGALPFPDIVEMTINSSNPSHNRVMKIN